MMREGLIHLLQSLPPKEQLLSQFPNFEEWWDNSHRWWFCLDFHLNIYYPALVTFVFSIVSRAWLMKLLTPWRQTLFTRGTIWESWWLEWTVLQILIMAQPFNPSEKMKRSDQSCRTFSGAELRYHLWVCACPPPTKSEIPPLRPFLNCINELCNGQSFEIYVGSILFLKSFISV